MKQLRRGVLTDIGCGFELIAGRASASGYENSFNERLVFECFLQASPGQEGSIVYVLRPGLTSLLRAVLALDVFSSVRQCRPGLGKSRVLDSVARAACDKGYSAKKVITADFLEELHVSGVDGSHANAFKRYEKCDILYLDEFGCDLFDTDAVKHLFRLFSARHQKRSILLAANTDFTSWKRFFPSEAQAVATVDRLIDQATILRFTDKSFRKPKQILGDECE